MDVPAEMAEKYFVLSRDAFAKALTLDPNNAGLKAAVQFARDQASQVEAFETARDAATDTFLAARRRDLTAMRHTPSVRVVSSMPPLPARELPRPVPPTRVNAAGTVAENAPVIIPASEGVASTDSANYGTRSDYSAAAAASPLVNPSPVTYLPFTTTAGVPYTYGQYSSTYFPSGVYSNSALPPVTIQRYGLAPARAMPNPLERRILNNAGAVSPR